MSLQRSHHQKVVHQNLQNAKVYRLVLMVAPPSIGVTEIIHEWREMVLSDSQVPALYIALKEKHNNEQQFLAELSAKFGIWNPRLLNQISLLPNISDSLFEGDRYFQRSPTAPSAVSENLIIEVINELMPLEEDLFLVMDNYQNINNIEIHNAVTFLINSLPPNIHLIILSHVQPPLQIAHLRVRRQMLEVKF